VYEDESGPTYCRYVGDDWELDRFTWWTRPNTRLNSEPLRCVQYSGKYPRYQGVRASKLVFQDDHREYGPEGSDPREIDTAAVMEEFRVYLADVVLPAITTYPVAQVIESTVVEAPIPMPEGVGSFFAYCYGSDARRIEIGKKDPAELADAFRYGLEGSGYRLAPTWIKRGPDLPEVAYDGFLWCGTTPKLPPDHSWGLSDMLVRVTPKDARGVFVADHAAYEKRRAELPFAFEGKRDCFTNDEVNDFVRARACTIVPIVDYKGNYEEPVYLINRELGFDEVEVIGARSS